MNDYSTILMNIITNILNYFDEVYHNAELLITDTGIKKPVITSNNEWISLVPSDKKEILYLRRNGDDIKVTNLGIGSCAKSYIMSSPMRLVYFKDHSKDPDKSLTYLMQSSLIQGTELKTIIRNKFKLLKDESSGDYNFRPSTAYFAIDFSIVWNLVPSDCEQDFCIDIANPFKRELCPVVA